MAQDIDALAPVSPVLSVVASGAMQSMDRLIGRKLLPRVRVSGKAANGTVFVENSGSFLGLSQGAGLGLRRPANAAFPTMQTADPTTVTYACEEFALASPLIPDTHMRRSQFPDDLPQREAEAVGRNLALQEEQRISQLFFATANWPDAALAAVSGAGAQWNNHNTATPLTDLEILRQSLYEQYMGVMPDTVIIGAAPAWNLVRCAQFRGVFFVTSGAASNVNAVINEEAAKQIIRDQIGIPNVYFGKARVRTSNPAQTLTAGYLWGTSVWIGCLDGANPVGLDGGSVRTRPVAALGIDEETVVSDALPQLVSGMAAPLVAGQTYQQPPAAPGVVVWARHSTDEIVLDTNGGLLTTAVTA